MTQLDIIIFKKGYGLDTPCKKLFYINMISYNGTLLITWLNGPSNDFFFFCDVGQTHQLGKQPHSFRIVIVSILSTWSLITSEVFSKQLFEEFFGQKEFFWQKRVFLIKISYLIKWLEINLLYTSWKVLIFSSLNVLHQCFWELQQA